eukprot:TRINITY_DN8724_c0_g1_i4.p1 TRINITY_DN8724_c0_g1~~TRINITY_DN8724_c0_g1_i4.p1  ORF type:complete len:331 (+),score=65.08 TRINITY_DN8724_c0_g1_i4:44-1036(+)
MAVPELGKDLEPYCGVMNAYLCEGCPPEWHARGGMPLEVNSAEGVPIDTADFTGKILFIHRPQPAQEDWPYKQHFEGKARQWELRLQGRFKTEPGDSLWFGAELPDPVELGWAARGAVTLILNLASKLSALRGVQFDYNLDWTDLGGGDEHRPHFTYPLLGADAVIQTPAGKTPPILSEPLAKMSMAEKQLVNLNTKDTYTFGFWTRYMDFVRWRITDMPFGANRSFESYIGKNPVHLTVYRLDSLSEVEAAAADCAASTPTETQECASPTTPAPAKHMRAESAKHIFMRIEVVHAQIQEDSTASDVPAGSPEEDEAEFEDAQDHPELPT